MFDQFKAWLLVTRPTDKMFHLWGYDLEGGMVFNVVFAIVIVVALSAVAIWPRKSSNRS